MPTLANSAEITSQKDFIDRFLAGLFSFIEAESLIRQFFASSMKQACGNEQLSWRANN